MRKTLAVTALAALAVGCGSAASAPNGGNGPDTSLRISFWSEGRPAAADVDPDTWALRCGPAGGTLPGSEAVACRKLNALKRPFAGPRKDVQCTQQYGGPQEAIISGTFNGNRIWVKLTLTDGCQIARFKRLAFLVPGFSPGGIDS